MKDKRAFLRGLALACLLCGLCPPVSPQESDGRAAIARKLGSLKSERLQLTRNYGQILTQSQSGTPNLNNQTPESPPNLSMPNDLSETFDSLQSEGADLFLTLDKQLLILETQLADSKTAIDDLQASLDNCLISLNAARQWADEMGRRLQENNEDLAAAFTNLDALSHQNADLKLQSARLQNQARRNGLIGFGFAGIGFGAGVPLVVEGVQRGNRSMALSGGGVIIGSAGLWLLGRYVFHWW